MRENIKKQENDTIHRENKLNGFRMFQKIGVESAQL